MFYEPAPATGAVAAIQVGVQQFFTRPPVSLLSRLLGGGGRPRPSHASESYKDFTNTADSAGDGPRWRISARIEKEIGGGVKTHTLICADTLEDEARRPQDRLTRGAAGAGFMSADTAAHVFDISVRACQG